MRKSPEDNYDNPLNWDYPWLQRSENPVLVGFYNLDMKISILSARSLFSIGLGTILQGQKAFIVNYFCASS